MGITPLGYPSFVFALILCRLAADSNRIGSLGQFFIFKMLNALMQHADNIENEMGKGFSFQQLLVFHEQSLFFIFFFFFPRGKDYKGNLFHRTEERMVDPKKII